MPFTRTNSRRDPRQTSHDGDPLLTFLGTKGLNANLASVNYRLSPFVRHPSHQEDVIAALAYLQKQYGMKEYILVGHSAGACLAFQSYAYVEGCIGIVGVEGIYDLDELVKEYPDYMGFVRAAFGDDRKVWEKASPTSIVRGRTLPTSITFLLVQSRDDELL